MGEAMNESRPLTKLQTEVLAVIKDARNGEISGLSIATWLLRRNNRDGIRTVLRSLENRGLIAMRPVNVLPCDDINFQWREQFPDRMTAMFSIRKDKEDALQKRT